MHDGFGSTLATARILLSHSGTATDAARVLDECRDDLRLVVDTLGHDDGRLDWALADFRQRLSERLKGGSVDVVFDVLLTDAPTLPQRTQLQLLRIAQEAVTNALRHAGATTITVRARCADGVLVLSVDDDGRGFPAPAPDPAGAPAMTATAATATAAARTTGRGLTNMARRARSIGATLAITPRAPGTRVEVRWSTATTPA
jgi:signal transduction histidine kinase